MIKADVQIIDKNKFKNVLLIINFNHPYYKNIDFLKELYAPYFNRIVFYGTKPHQEVTCFETNEGRYISEVLYDALEKNPGYDGYLFLEDDCILNMWNCFQLDISKIWILTVYNPDANGRGYIAHGRGYTWANLALETFEHSWAWPSNMAATKNAFSQLLPRDIKNVTNNIGKDIAIGTSADMCYFPGKYRDDVMRMCPIFKEVFIEIAMPNMLACLDDRTRWETVSVMWGITDNQLRTKWPLEYTCVHPVKLSSTANRDLTKNIFAQMMPIFLKQ